MAEVFHIVPASGRSTAAWLPLLGVLAVVLVGAVALVATSMRGSRMATFELSPDGLQLRGDLYGRLIAASELRGGAARVVDVERERALQPTRRTFGTGLPGYRAGWFRLADGSKALLYLTDPRQAVYVPTRSGYALLLSVDRPHAFVERLRAIAPAA